MLGGGACFTEFHPTRGVPAPSEPDAPNDPPGVVSDVPSASTRGHLAGRGLGAVDGRDGPDRRCCAQSGEAEVTRRAGHHDAPGDGGQAGDESGEDRLLDLLAGDDEDERGEVRLAVGLIICLGHQAGALQAGAERGHSGGVHGLGPLRRADRVADELADPVVRRGVGGDDVRTELVDSWRPRVSTRVFSPVSTRARRSA